MELFRELLTHQIIQCDYFDW